jgi:hypothetical protein
VHASHFGAGMIHRRCGLPAIKFSSSRGFLREDAMNLNEYAPFFIMLIPTGLVLGAVILSLLVF